MFTRALLHIIVPGVLPLGMSQDFIIPPGKNILRIYSHPPVEISQDILTPSGGKSILRYVYLPVKTNKDVCNLPGKIVLQGRVSVFLPGLNKTKGVFTGGGGKYNLGYIYPPPLQHIFTGGSCILAYFYNTTLLTRILAHRHYIQNTIELRFLFVHFMVAQ